MKDETSFEMVKGKAGRPAAQVWSFLQSEEVRANAGPKGELQRQVDQISRGTGLSAQEVQDAVIKLAVHRLITKITPDGRVVA